MIDESYLTQLCEHLGQTHPRAGAWTRRARRWHLPGALQHRMPLFSCVELDELYLAADQSGLPRPHATPSDVNQHAAEANALGVVLAAQAGLSARGGSHQPGRRSIAVMLSNVHAIHVGALFRQFRDWPSRGFSTLLHHCGHSSSWHSRYADLRTLAALAYQPGSCAHEHLTIDVGLWPGAAANPGCYWGTSIRWDPFKELGRDVWTPGSRKRQAGDQPLETPGPALSSSSRSDAASAVW